MWKDRKTAPHGDDLAGKSIRSHNHNFSILNSKIIFVYYVYVKTNKPHEKINPIFKPR